MHDDHRLLARFRSERWHAEQARKLGEILLETGLALPVRSPAPALPGDDARLLRGLPVVGVRGGLGGAMLGTRPDLRRDIEEWAGHSSG